MKTLIIIPTYNEIENIGKLIFEIFSVAPYINVLIIDDSSPDGTGKFVEDLAKNDERIKVIHRKNKLGLGSAYKLGFKYAIEKNYDYIFEMDADFSHDPKDIPRFLEKIKEADLVIGSRYCNGVSVINWPITRLLLSYFANLYARIVTNTPIKDLTSGFKCYRRKVLEEIPLKKIKVDGYGFQIATVFYAYKRGFKVVEIPVIFTERSKGKSKFSKKIIWEAFWLVLKLRFISLFIKK